MLETEPQSDQSLPRNWSRRTLESVYEPSESVYEPSESEYELSESEQEPGKSGVSWTGIGIAIFGVLLPAVTLTAVFYNGMHAAVGVLLRHPIETLLQFALVLVIPIGNFLVLHLTAKRNYKHYARTGIINGLATGAATAIVIACFAALALHYPCLEGDTEGTYCDGNFQTVSFIALLSICASLVLAFRLRNFWETDTARLRQTIYSVLGVVLAFLTVGATELRPTVIRLAEQNAINGTPEQIKEGLSVLRRMEVKKDLTMDIADVTSGGLSGMFLRTKPEDRLRLFFLTTGKIYDDDKGGIQTVSNRSQTYLGSHVVGAMLPGLSLVRSELSGAVNGQSVVADLDWTSVFKNSNLNPMEVRAELQLPAGAVVSDLTLWQNGQPHHSTIGLTEQAQDAYRWVTSGRHRRDPALVTDLGQGRVLVQASPVAPASQMKLRISMHVPLKLYSGKQSTLVLPRLLATNFEVGGQNNLRLRSNESMQLSLNDVRSTSSADGQQLLSGNLKADDLSARAISIRVSRKNTFIAVAAPNMVNSEGGYFIESIKHNKVYTPTHLVVCVDGSANIKEHVGEIKSALRSLPKSLSTSMVIANSDDQNDLPDLPLEAGLARLRADNMIGGHENLRAVIKAAEVAGESQRGAVLWIHGPQQSFNQEMYITSVPMTKPKFYEMGIDDNSTQVSEFFKSNPDIGPFQPVSRNGSITEDLNRFTAQWRPDSRDYYMDYSYMSKKPTCEIITDTQTCQTMAALYGEQLTGKLLDSKDYVNSGRIAAYYHIVSPLTAAVVLERASDYERFQMKDSDQQEQLNAGSGHFGGGNSGFGGNGFTHSTGNGFTHGSGNGGSSFGRSIASIAQAPSLQGATNGTIRPQADDATLVTGVNTAGTVRVNNLANLEALLNIASNVAQLGGIFAGVLLAGSALTANHLTFGRMRFSRSQRFAFAVVVVLVGMSVPGCINYMFASARDANLFS